jgi:NhaA family Na+:H+ antiporter
MVALAMLLAFAMRRMHVMSFWLYLLFPGVLAWWGFHLGGVHPSIALLPVIPFMPHKHHADQMFAEPPVKARDPLSKFDRWWSPPVQGILFLFGVVNGGVPVHGLEPGMWALPIGSMIGRPIGVLIAVELAVLAGLHRTMHLTWRDIVVIGCTSSIGLGFALFSGSALLPLGVLQQQTKTGALLTVGGAVLALGAAWILGVGRFGRTPAPTIEVESHHQAAQ